MCKDLGIAKKQNASPSTAESEIKKFSSETCWYVRSDSSVPGGVRV